MHVQIQSVYQTTALNGIKVLVYGRAGSGKTVLGATAPNPIFISAENGLLSLRKVIEERRIATGNPHYDIPAIPITDMQSFRNAAQWAIGNKQAQQFGTFALDSISEIGERIVAEERKKTKDPRQAYGHMFDEVMQIFRDFRDKTPGKNVLFIAKEEIVKAGVTGAVRYVPSFPGQAILPHSPYMFDETFRLFIGKDTDGKDYRGLLTQPDWESEAKDRSGRLDPVEYPDLTYLFNKMMNVQQGQT